MSPLRSQIVTRRALLASAASLAAASLAAASLAAASLAASPAAARGAPSGRPVVVASKIDTEGALLGSLIAATLRRGGIAVDTRLQLGPTRILRQALLSGAIDLYPEYTGNGAGFFHQAGDPAWHDPEAAWRRVRALDEANGLAWLRPAPADNGWGIALRRERAAQAGLATLDDLARHLRAGRPLLLVASVEFVESADALPAFERAYGFRLRQEQLLMLAGGDTSATIRAAAEGLSGVDAAMAYGTDGALAALGLVLLADPRHAQIVFQPAPVVRRAVLVAEPVIEGLLAPLFARLTLPVLRGLNARIAAEGMDPAAVVAEFLAPGAGAG